MKVHSVTLQDPGFEHWLGPILDAPEPQIWADAEIDMQRRRHRDPNKRWWLSVIGGQVLAWCAAWPYTGRDVVADLECGHNYERRGLGRQLGAYRLAFAARQKWIEDRQVSCVTHVFDQPVGLHEAAGWVPVKAYDHADVSEQGHHWQRMIFMSGDLFGPQTVLPPGFVLVGAVHGRRQHLARQDRLRPEISSCGRRGESLCGRTRVGDQHDVNWRRAQVGLVPVDLAGLLACGGCVRVHRGYTDDDLIKIADLEIRAGLTGHHRIASTI